MHRNSSRQGRTQMGTLTSTLVLGLLAATALVFSPLAAQDKPAEKPAPKKDNPEVPALLKSLDEITKGKAEKDSEGKPILDKLGGLYESLPPAQQKLVLKGIEGCFRAKRQPEEVELYMATGEALSRLAKPGGEALSRVIDDKRFKNKKEWSAFRSQMVRLLGRPADKAFLETLLDIATKDNDNQARAMAGEALGEYAKFEQATRKEITEKLVKGLEEVHAKANANLDPNDLQRKEFVDREAIIQDAWTKTLARMTGQEIKEVQAWTKWWNDNKGENWDKKGFGGTAVPGKRP